MSFGQRVIEYVRLAFRGTAADGEMYDPDPPLRFYLAGLLCVPCLVPLARGHAGASDDGGLPLRVSDRYPPLIVLGAAHIQRVSTMKSTLIFYWDIVYCVMSTRRSFPFRSALALTLLWAQRYEDRCTNPNPPLCDMRACWPFLAIRTATPYHYTPWQVCEAVHRV